MRAHELIAQIGGQHAPGREHGGHVGDHDAADLEKPRHLRDLQAGGATEGDERELARIHAAAHGDDLDPLGHVRVDDLGDALGGGEALGAKRARDTVHRHLCGASVEGDAAAEKIAGIEKAEDDVGVGHRRAVAAFAIAGRAGIGAGALGPDVQDSARIDRRDRAAAGAQRVDVEARQRDLGHAHRLFAGERGLAALEQRDVGAGAAHVEGDEVAGLSYPW